MMTDVIKPLGKNSYLQIRQPSVLTDDRPLGAYKMILWESVEYQHDSDSDPVEYPQVWNPEEMAGNLTLLGTNKIKQRVQVKVYRTSIEHFAVLYPQKKVCRPLGVLNLKNTMVETLPSSNHSGFTIRQCGFDTPLCSLTFFCDTNREVERWISAFTCRRKGVSSRTNASSLPVVEESEEV